MKCAISGVVSCFVALMAMGSPSTAWAATDPPVAGDFAAAPARDWDYDIIDANGNIDAGTLRAIEVVFPLNSQHVQNHGGGDYRHWHFNQQIPTGDLPLSKAYWDFMFLTAIPAEVTSSGASNTSNIFFNCYAYALENYGNYAGGSPGDIACYLHWIDNDAAGRGLLVDTNPFAKANVQIGDIIYYTDKHMTVVKGVDNALHEPNKLEWKWRESPIYTWTGQNGDTTFDTRGWEVNSVGQAARGNYYGKVIEGQMEQGKVWRRNH